MKRTTISILNRRVRLPKREPVKSIRPLAAIC